MSLASLSGDEIKVFSDADGGSVSSVPTQIRQTSALFGKITWSGDAKWIAVTPLKSADDPLPVYKCGGNELTPKKYVNIASITSASFFNWTNRNLVVGTQCGLVYIWDLMDRKIALNVDVHKQRESVDHLCVNSDDTLLATASMNNNKVFVNSLNTNKVVQSLDLPNSQGASSLSYCMCKKGYLAASSYESTICVWDVMRGDTIFKNLNSHYGACTDLAFSPINYCVIASVGLTKQLKIYDLRQGSLIFDVNMGVPMHCIDMISNGDKVAVGGSDGTVIIYDLRGNKIHKQIKAHDGPVLSVKMQLMKLPKKYKEVEMNTPDVIEVQNKTLDLSVIDVFSPINRIGETGCTSTSKSVSFKTINKTAVEDSFLSKFLTPKREDIFMSTPVEDSSNKKSQVESMNNTGLGTVVEEPADNNEVSFKVEDSQETTPGDGFHIRRQGLEQSLQNFLRETKKMHQEQLNAFKDLSDRLHAVEKEVQTMKLDIEGKHQLLQENHDNLLQFLIKGIKEEIFAGNCDSKIEHICQRLLLENLEKTLIEKCELIIKGIRK